MKEIGILTFHYVDNYGAVLQAYALSKILNSFPEINAKIINYIPKWFEYTIYENTEEGYLKFKNKRQKFERFIIDKCNIEKKMITSVSDICCDYCCVGSDQVWNLDYMSDDYFLLNADSVKNKISYAASVGMSQENIYKKSGFIKQALQSFKAISVRELQDANCISSICKRKCEVTLDPTLLLDAYQYMELIPEMQKQNEYIFFFWIKHDDTYMRGVEFVNRLSREYHLPIIHSFWDAPKYMFANDGGCMIYDGIEEFLWYIKNAKFIVTNSYHVTLFSIQFKKKFFAFTSNAMNSRFETLKQLFHIDKEIFKTFEVLKNTECDIDYKKLEEEISGYRKQSIMFLKQALDISERS